MGMVFLEICCGVGSILHAIKERSLRKISTAGKIKRICSLFQSSHFIGNFLSQKLLPELQDGSGMLGALLGGMLKLSASHRWTDERLLAFLHPQMSFSTQCPQSGTSEGH